MATPQSRSTDLRMDTNYIRKDGFSNPETERLYKTWDRERGMASLESRQNCGACLDRYSLIDSPGQYCWFLCLGENSPHFLETLHWSFGCPQHQLDDSIRYFVLP